MKKSKKEVNYTEFPVGDGRCFDCRYKSFDGCSLVKGKIDIRARCDLFRYPEEVENAHGVDALENK